MAPSAVKADPAASATATPSASKSSTRATPKSKIAILKLSSKALLRFPHDPSSPVPREKSVSSSTPSAQTPSTSTNKASNNVADTNEGVADDSTSVAANGADSNAASTPAATSNGLLAPPQNSAKRKGVPGPKPGMKRTASQVDTNGVPKPRGKPGPKKKPRIGENGEVVNGAVQTAPKLGPKANQGAINACLRALDRTGKPCRRWVRKPFVVRSFTGYGWGAGSYAAIRKEPSTFDGDVKSDTSSSGDKPTHDSSAMQSEKSTSGADADTSVPPNGLTSSPAPAVAVNASG
ncbi:uncharacterized protein PV09_00764 [Verruconis gallopava]|uniref:Uncharacterized protein n=1 Tax=Verruconis gallopava TaxID=253628 RepID=A0A0D2AQN1_9PEZI|nr:uncharacterized protein PV09_00764 [Verruconis gallopava]KIW08835.1 hypothetical protein PV09_00764 [Verruconis gallopava]